MKLKKSFLILSVMSLSACSSISSMFTFSDENESILKPNDSEIKVIKLDTAGLNLPPQDPKFAIPNILLKQNDKPVDLRPPVIPMALISNSQADFDGKKIAFILFPIKMQSIYNLTQIARVLGEKRIKTEIKNNHLITDWINIDNIEDKDIAVKYEIIQVILSSGESGLYIWIKDLKVNNELVEPTLEQKQRYTVTLLNEIIGTLTNAYQQQKKALLY